VYTIWQSENEIKFSKLFNPAADSEFTVFPVIVADVTVEMNALASFIAYVPVAFVQKILTSLNSTLLQRGQAVSVSSRAYIDLNQHFTDAIGHLDEIIGRGLQP